MYGMIYHIPIKAESQAAGKEDNQSLHYSSNTINVANLQCLSHPSLQGNVCLPKLNSLCVYTLTKNMKQVTR